MVTFEAELEMHGAARLLNPVMKLAFEKRAGDTENRLTTVLNRLADPAQPGGASR